MKLTIDLPEEIVLELKLRAILQGRTIKDLAAEVLRESLGLDKPVKQDQSPVNARIQIDKNGFPAFRSAPTVPASGMTIEESLKLEQDAGLAEDLYRAGLSGQYHDPV